MLIIGHPSLTTNNKPNQFIVERGFKAIRGNWTLTIEPGLIINGASIPKPFTLIFDRFDPRYNRPSIIHDALVGEFCDKVKVTNSQGHSREVSWKEAAVWFREAIKEEGGNKLLRRVFYHAVMLKKRLHLL